MKRIIFTLALSAILTLSFAQKTVVNSIADGNWLMPTTWDCTCIPATSDNVIIHNNVTLNTNWVVTSGSVTINPSASLVKDNLVRTWALNGGTFTNHGTFTVDQVANYSGTILNTGIMTVNHAFLNNDSLKNSGTISNVDSLQNNHFLVNNTGGKMTVTNLWNNESMNNVGKLYLVYFLNTHSFINNGYLQSNKFLNTDSCSINDSVMVYMDFMNTGNMKVSANVLFDVTHNFLNGDSLTHDAYFTNNGHVLIGNDFTNLDTIKGSTGYFCIASYSTNHGYIGGTVDICDQTPLGGPPYIDLNTGTITTSVTSCTQACNAGIIDNSPENSSVIVYPNPFNNELSFEFSGNVPLNSKIKLSIFDMLGQVVLSDVYTVGKISIERNNMKNGIYFYQLQTSAGLYTGKIIAE